MMLLAMLSIAGRMIGMTRDALCVNVNSLVSALAQRSTCARPPHSQLHLLFDRVTVASSQPWLECMIILHFPWTVYGAQWHGLTQPT